MQQITQGLDELVTEILVQQMINPKNKDFYIKELTVDKIISLLAEMPAADPSLTEIFWTAFKKAQKYLKTEELLGL